jgi:hypothetical protein
MIGIFLVVIGGFGLIMNSIYLFVQIHKKYDNNPKSNNNNKNTDNSQKEAVNIILNHLEFFFLKYVYRNQRGNLYASDYLLRTQLSKNDEVKELSRTYKLQNYIIFEILFYINNQIETCKRQLKNTQLINNVKIEIIYFSLDDKKQYSIIIPMNYKYIPEFEKEEYSLDKDNIIIKENNTTYCMK